MKKALALLLALLIAASPITALAEAPSEAAEAAITEETSQETLPEAPPASESPTETAPVPQPAAETVIPSESTEEAVIPSESAAEPVPASDPAALPEEEPAAEAAPETAPTEAPEPAPAYPWSSMSDAEFAAYIQSPENTARLKSILQDPQSELCHALQERVRTIADPTLRATIEAYLDALTTPAPVVTESTAEPVEETTEPATEEAPVEEVTEPVEDTPAEESTESAEEAPVEESIEPAEEAPTEEATEPAPEAPPEEVTEPADQAPETIDVSSLGIPEDAVLEESSLDFEEEISEANATYSGTCGDNLTWVLDTNGTLTISGSGDMANWLSDYASSWYNYRTYVKSVKISSGVTSIGSQAFEYCSNLTSITISDSVTSIGAAAFRGCNSLISIIIPDSVTSIGNAAFSGCYSLTSITLPFIGASRTASGSSNTGFGFIFGTSSYPGGTETRQYSNPNTFYYVPSSLRNVTITDTNQIPFAAFYDCISLTSITIPDCVTSIGKCAFLGCLGLADDTGMVIVNNVVYDCNLCDEHYVSTLYRVFFDRSPGEEELAYHAGRLSSGAKREDIFNGFALSGEYGALCRSYGILQGGAIDASGAGTVPTGPCTVEGCGAVPVLPEVGVSSFVERLYAICLNRPAGSSEVAYYAELLNGRSISGAQAAWNFFSSPEFTSHGYSNREYILRLYEVLMDRDPAEEEITYHAGRLTNGASRVDVFNGFAQSAEFLHICETYGIDRGGEIPG